MTRFDLGGPDKVTMIKTGRATDEEKHVFNIELCYFSKFVIVFSKYVSVKQQHG